MTPDGKRLSLGGPFEDGPYTPRSNELEESVLAKKRGVATEAGQEKLGERVALLRKERGLTQVELAEALGVAQSIVSKYESGELRLHGELIIQLAELLDVSADELLGLVERPRTGPAKDKRLARRLQGFDRLPKRDRDALTRTIDAFLAARSAGGRAAA
jgi:transcriptional regulator with XRE-family HTH domain